MLESVKMSILLTEIHILYSTKLIYVAMNRNNVCCYGGNICIVISFRQLSFCPHGAIN